MISPKGNFNNRAKSSNKVILRDVTLADQSIFFEHQLDPDANHMAAFTAKDPTDREYFDAKWEKMINDKGLIIKTIVFNGEVAGSVLSHKWFGDPEVSYWIGKEYWGKGIATRALKYFLSDLDIRPLYARVVKDNIGSIRVLEKCGFKVSGHDKGFANARGEEVQEIIFALK